MLDPGEVHYAVEQEMALHLTDLLFRRAGIAAEGMPTEATLMMCADRMAELLGWDAEQRQTEIEMIRNHFDPLQ